MAGRARWYQVVRCGRDFAEQAGLDGPIHRSLGVRLLGFDLNRRRPDFWLGARMAADGAVRGQRDSQRRWPRLGWWTRLQPSVERACRFPDDLVRSTAGRRRTHDSQRQQTLFGCGRSYHGQHSHLRRQSSGGQVPAAQRPAGIPTRGAGASRSAARRDCRRHDRQPSARRLGHARCATRRGRRNAAPQRDCNHAFLLSGVRLQGTCGSRVHRR